MRRRTLVWTGTAALLLALAPSFARADAAASRAVGAVLQWTVNGDPAGPPMRAPCGANDVHFRWDAGQAVLTWTVDDEPIGDPILAPLQANDAHFVWDPVAGRFRGVRWTQDGQVIGQTPAPLGANDAELKLDGALFTGAIWTRNGNFLGAIPIPVGANDAHVDLVAEPVPATLQWTIDGNPTGPLIDAPCGANDLHVRWQGGEGTLTWTQDGEPIAMVPVPPQANDAHFVWDPATGAFRGVRWTQNGEPIGQAPAPFGANDAELVLGVGAFTQAMWTRNGRPLGDPFPAPAGSNDVHVDVFKV